MQQTAIDAATEAVIVSVMDMSDAPPILTAAAMREAERRVIAGGVTGRRLMERAGRAAADAAMAMIAPGATVSVLCGPGNNGGDGFVVARVLRDRGYAVRVGLLGERTALAGDAAAAARDWGDAVAPAADLDLDAALVVDGLFGTGLSRPLAGEAARIVEAVNRAGRPVLALDIPSGIDADTGAVLGAAIRASATVTFAASKPGHWLMPGRDHAGALRIADIGVDPGGDRWPRLNHPSLWTSALPRPERSSHKYDRGHALVVSGEGSRSGAARLSARGALRAGAGLVTVLAPQDAVLVHAARLDAVMVRRCDDAAALAAILEDRRLNALVVGPGGGVGERTAAMALAAAESGRAVVLDADALTSLAGQPGRIAQAARGNGAIVLTPHDGEFARLFGGLGGDLDSPSKCVRALAAARTAGAIVVSKGPDTVVAAPDGRVVINATGTPNLATAGSGDVLSGMIAGLMAQGMPAFEAACAGVWMHGRVAEAFGPGLISEDIADRLPPVLATLLA